MLSVSIGAVAVELQSLNAERLWAELPQCSSASGLYEKIKRNSFSLIRHDRNATHNTTRRTQHMQHGRSPAGKGPGLVGCELFEHGKLHLELFHLCLHSTAVKRDHVRDMKERQSRSIGVQHLGVLFFLQLDGLLWLQLF